MPGGAVAAGPGCEAPGTDLLTEPVAAVSSLAFVVAAAVVLVARRRRAGERADERDRGLLVYAALVAGIGAGSVVQHGPDPWWSGVPHDVPLMGTLAFVAADAVADLTGRRRHPWWWLVPTLALVPAALWWPVVSTVAQSVVAAAAVGLTLLRAWRRPALRRPVLTGVALLAVGAVVGRLSRAGGPLCDPGSLLQGHAVWHVLAATALAVLTPAIARR